jgi:hypothetical protein
LTSTLQWQECNCDAFSFEQHADRLDSIARSVAIHWSESMLLIVNIQIFNMNNLIATAILVVKLLNVTH